MHLVNNFRDAVKVGYLRCSGRPHAGGLRPQFTMRYEGGFLKINSHTDFSAKIFLRAAIMREEADNLIHNKKKKIRQEDLKMKIHGHIVEECEGYVELLERGARVRLESSRDDLCSFWLEVTMF